MLAFLCRVFREWYQTKDKCCRCIPLRPGSITIGYTLVVLKSLLLTFTCVLYIMNLEDSGRPENSHINFKFIMAVNTICIIIQKTEVLLAIILIVGLHLNNFAIVKVFIVGAPASFIILVVLFIITIIKNVTSAANNREWVIFIPEMLFAVYLSVYTFLENGVLATQEYLSKSNVNAFKDFYIYCIRIVKIFYKKQKSSNVEQDTLNMEQENMSVDQTP